VDTRRLDTLQTHIANEMKEALGIAANVRLMGPKSIARSQGKAVRVVDRRESLTRPARHVSPPLGPPRWWEARAPESLFRLVGKPEPERRNPYSGWWGSQSTGIPIPAGGEAGAP